MLAIQVIMPSEGDMSLLAQDGGTITLRPMFFGGECAGPHIRVVETTVKDGVVTVSKTHDNYRMKIRSDGRIELKKGQTAEDISKQEQKQEQA